MKLMSLFAVAALIMGVAVVGPAYAGGSMESDPKSEPKTDEPKKEEPKKEAKKQMDFEAMLKDVDKVVGGVTFNADDMKVFKEKWAAATKELKKDAKFKELKETNVKEAYDQAITVAEYKKWATDNKVSAEDFLKKGMRIILQHVKLEAPDMIKQGREQIDGGRKMLDAYKDKLGEKKYAEQSAQLDDATKMLDGMEKGCALIPDPSADEKKLLEDNKEAIQTAMDSDKDESKSTPPSK